MRYFHSNHSAGIAMCKATQEREENAVMNAQWIDKVEVGHRQVREAVCLFFEERDPVVIHTIIAAAHQILVDLGKDKGIEGSIKNSKTPSNQPAQDYITSINYPFNFLKHADRDSDAKMNVGPLNDFTRHFILDAIVMLQRISGDIPIAAKVFWTRVVSKYPEDFEGCAPEGPIAQMQKVELGQLDFPKLRQFVLFAEIAEEAQKGAPETKHNSAP